MSGPSYSFPGSLLAERECSALMGLDLVRLGNGEAAAADADEVFPVGEAVVEVALAVMVLVVAEVVVGLAVVVGAAGIMMIVVMTDDCRKAM